jgi:hypothetical protein
VTFYKSKDEAIKAIFEKRAEIKDADCDHVSVSIEGNVYECRKCHKIFEEKYPGILIEMTGN